MCEIFKEKNRNIIVKKKKMSEEMVLKRNCVHFAISMSCGSQVLVTSAPEKPMFSHGFFGHLHSHMHIVFHPFDT